MSGTAPAGFTSADDSSAAAALLSVADTVTQKQQLSWEDVQNVQSMIERCLQQYMTQTEIITALQQQADVDPTLTVLVWQKLEEQNPAFFYAYNMRLRLRDQIVAFNYLIAQQVKFMKDGRQPPSRSHLVGPPLSSPSSRGGGGSIAGAGGGGGGGGAGGSLGAGGPSGVVSLGGMGDVGLSGSVPMAGGVFMHAPAHTSRQELDVAVFLANTPKSKTAAAVAGAAAAAAAASVSTSTGVGVGGSTHHTGIGALPPGVGAHFTFDGPAVLNTPGGKRARTSRSRHASPRSSLGSAPGSSSSTQSHPAPAAAGTTGPVASSGLASGARRTTPRGSGAQPSPRRGIDSGGRVSAASAMSGGALGGLVDAELLEGGSAMLALTDTPKSSSRRR